MSSEELGKPVGFSGSDQFLQDIGIHDVANVLFDADSDGKRTGRVLRETFDQLYDGQRTGRYSWDQLFKTEKTHFGTLFEINFRREFDEVIDDGHLLDFEIAGYQVDCKFSQTDGGWMLPPECRQQILMVVTASDHEAKWSLGIVRAKTEYLRSSENRDAKTGLSKHGRSHITWLHREADLPSNVLLNLTAEDIEAVFAHDSGQKRINELIRRAEGMSIGRAAIATVAQQADYMKRVRGNGGARSLLAPEGYLIVGGDFNKHRSIIVALGIEPPKAGEILGVRVAETAEMGPWIVEIDSRYWRRARPDERQLGVAPELPSISP